MTSSSTETLTYHAVEVKVTATQLNEGRDGWDTRIEVITRDVDPKTVLDRVIHTDLPLDHAYISAAVAEVGVTRLGQHERIVSEGNVETLYYYGDLFTADL